MGTFTLLPVLDVKNRGWTLSGGETTLYATWNNDTDTKYASSPVGFHPTTPIAAARGIAEVSFPLDTASLPEGAVVTSVTASLRMKKTVSSTKMINLSLVTADEETRFLSRAEFATDAITNHDILTTTVDALDEGWDVHRLNKLVVRVYAHNSVAADEIRIYKVYLTVNYSVRPEVTIVEPSGTLYTPTPTINWDYTNSEGIPDESAEYKVFLASDVSSPSFNPDLDTPVYESTVDGGLYTFRVGDALPSGDYVLYMRATSVHGAVSAWATKEFEVSAPQPAIPGNDTNGALGSAPTTVPDSDLSAVHVTVRDSSNLLSMQQGDADLTTDHLEWVGTNATLSRDTTSVYTRGRGSIKVLSSSGTATATSTFVEVSPSTPFTIRAQVLTAVTSRTATLSVQFYTSEYATVGSATSVAAADSTSTWTELVATGTTQATAAYFKLTVSWASTAASEVHYVDRIGFMYGTNSAWSSGGHLSRNLLSSFVATADALDTVGLHFLPDNASTTIVRQATSGTGSHGVDTYKMTYTGASPSIAHRATGTAYTRTTSGTAFTLNAPASTADDDLMVAFVSVDSNVSINVPTGWTLVNSVSITGTNQMFVLKRSFVTGDPASWAGTFATSTPQCYARVISYSGAAPASEQFVAHNVRADSSSNQVHETATVNNTVANAWRLTAFTFKDNSAESLTKANIASDTVPPDIEYVGKGAKWSYSGDGTTSFTIQKPSGVASGDLMLAFIGMSGDRAISAAPTGWTLVKRYLVPPVPGDYPTQRAAMGELTMAVYKRTAGASESASWTGTITTSSQIIITGTAAYRNCKDFTLQFTTENTNYGFSSAVSTTEAWTQNTINNTNSRAVSVAALLTGRTSTPDPYSIQSDFGPRRSSEYVVLTQSGVDTHDMSITFWDSDNPISTGQVDYRLYSTLSHIWLGTFVGLLQPLDTVPAPGANETERIDAGVSSTLYQAVVDSAAAVPTGNSSVFGTWSGTTPQSSTSWVGLIKPADASPAGLAAVKMEELIDISNVDPWIYDLSDNKMSVVGHFLGSTAGSPLLSLEFYRANQLLNSYTSVGSVFNATVWSKSSAVFDIPAGTTHVRMALSATDRAVSDYVLFDRLSIAFGDSTVWRNGTGADEHPVWSRPHIQYSDDNGSGFSEWADVPGLQVNPPEYDPRTGLVTFVDHTAVPLVQRKYRIKTVTYGLEGDQFVSSYGPESDPVTFSAQSGAWWLKDLYDPDSSLEMHVKADPTNISKIGTTAKFHPLGEDYAVTVSDGYKGDEFEITVVCDSEEYVTLKDLVTSERALFLKSDVDEAWWIKPFGDLSSTILVTGRRQVDPVRFVTLKYVQVKAEL